MDGGIDAWKTAGFASLKEVSPFVHLFYHEDTSTCCFVVVDEESKQCAIIDPVLDYSISSGKVSTKFADMLIEFVKINELNVAYLLETRKAC
jgi:glyoxylase-like metal-dependent hydrolase (beta-lactamase superfamily II)